MAGPFTSGHKVFNTDINPMLLGWVDFIWFGLTLAYVSADAPTFVFSVDADVTDVIEPGMRIKLTQTTDKFFIVTAVGAFAAGVTPITVYGGTDYTLLNATITAGAFSTHKKPFGFNADPLKWREEFRDATDRAQSSPSAGTWYNTGSLSLVVPIGAWVLEYEAAGYATNASGTNDMFVTLSTANNSQSDVDLTSWERVNSATIAGFTATRRKNLLLATKATYFLNTMTAQAAMTNLNFLGSSTSPSILRAVCAYL